MSGNRLVSIIANDCTPMLTKPCPQRSACFPNVKRGCLTYFHGRDKNTGLEVI